MCVRAYILAVRGFLLVLHIICIYLQAIVCFCSCNSNVLDIIILVVVVLVVKVEKYYSR